MNHFIKWCKNENSLNREKKRRKKMENRKRIILTWHGHKHSDDFVWYFIVLPYEYKKCISMIGDILLKWLQT